MPKSADAEPADAEPANTDPALFPIPEGARQVRRRVVLLTGPSGSGKSSLTRRLGLPVVSLDDFYRDIDYPGMPQRYGSVDWDSPATWDHRGAAEALLRLCRDGASDLPIYDIPTSRRTGGTRLVLEDDPVILAEGIFAAELVTTLREMDILADAICLVRPRLQTFWFRILRDFGEARKPPMTLLRRGISLFRTEPALIEAWVGKGCRAAGISDAEHSIRALASRAG